MVSCIARATGSWLMAISTGRPMACSMPVEAPPPPAKLSTTSSPKLILPCRLPRKVPI